MTTTQAAAYAGVTQAYVRWLIRHGVLKAKTQYNPVTANRVTYLVTKAELDRWKAIPKRGPGRPRMNSGV